MPRKPASKTKTLQPLKAKRIHKALTQKPQTNRELRATLGLGYQKFDPRLDRKLQQLRKEGKIQLVGSHWAVLTVMTCPHCEGRGWVENKAKVDPATAPPPS